jgi:NAD-dependent SIR2 family protein deacetylase
MQKLGLRFENMSNPYWFTKDPSFAWGFFGHRYKLYNGATPHQGYHLMKKWGEAKKLGYFVFTSNVDGHCTHTYFDCLRCLGIKTGVPDDKVVECHGSVHYVQCLQGCTDAIWPSIDEPSVTSIFIITWI